MDSTIKSQALQALISNVKLLKYYKNLFFSWTVSKELREELHYYWTELRSDETAVAYNLFLQLVNSPPSPVLIWTIGIFHVIFHEYLLTTIHGNDFINWDW